MISFLVRIFGNALALFAAFLLVPGFLVTGGIEQYVLAGLVLAILNMIVKPILKIITFPVIILTLGIFTIVINALILSFVDYLFTTVTIEGLVALVWATIVVSIVNFIVSLFSKIV
ncbi:MAG TPA: phage holin family protein [Candidatus Paceibacterota bacterium]|nr:phage holin family protein [Candidatus Paceibacterota bacterium]